jgi:hypothetical protein
LSAVAGCGYVDGWDLAEFDDHSRGHLVACRKENVTDVMSRI